LAVGWALRDGDVDEARIGEPAPDFTVAVIDGASFSLAEHLESDGRPLVLNLWASWCLPCRTEIPEISAFADNNPDFRVIGVAVDDTETAAIGFARSIGATYDLAIGDRDFESAYPRLGLPVTYFIDSDGIVTDVFNGVLNEATLADLAGG
jgi:cytochrome c biogenesis protein CcmG/thiol:disulfide interchange protein DsbE